MALPTDRLTAEHRNIERMLDVIEEMCRRLAAAGPVPGKDVQDAVRFIREYADKLHHGKEEDLLFAEMNRAGFPREMGPVAVMLAEHDEGRRLVRGLDEAAAKLPDAAAAKAVIADGRGYAALLRDHIRKEDECLYPMANQRLSQAQQDALEAGFRKVDEQVFGPEKIAELLALLDRLAKAYLPAVAPV